MRNPPQLFAHIDVKQTPFCYMINAFSGKVFNTSLLKASEKHGHPGKGLRRLQFEVESSTARLVKVFEKIYFTLGSVQTIDGSSVSLLSPEERLFPLILEVYLKKLKKWHKAEMKRALQKVKWLLADIYIKQRDVTPGHPPFDEVNAAIFEHEPKLLDQARDAFISSQSLIPRSEHPSDPPEWAEGEFQNFVSEMDELRILAQTKQPLL